MEGDGEISYLRDEVNNDNANPEAWWIVDTLTEEQKKHGHDEGHEGETDSEYYDWEYHYTHIDASTWEDSRWITYDFEGVSDSDKEVGRLLGYTIENTNSIATDYDLRERATGVLFKVHYEPYNPEEGTAGEFYVYKNQAYNSLEAIWKQNQGDFEENTFEEFQKNYLTYGIVKYEDGESYLPYWIKHDEDNDDTAYGTMEYGIVRNNLYELHVTSITDFGEMIVTVKAWDVWDTEDVLLTPQTNTGGE